MHPLSFSPADWARSPLPSGRNRSGTLCRHRHCKGSSPSSNIDGEQKAPTPGKIFFSHNACCRKNRSKPTVLSLCRNHYMEGRSFATFKKHWPEKKLALLLHQTSHSIITLRLRLPVGTAHQQHDGRSSAYQALSRKGFQIHQDIPEDVWESFEKPLQHWDSPGSSSNNSFYSIHYETIIIDPLDARVADCLLFQNRIKRNWKISSRRWPWLVMIYLYRFKGYFSRSLCRPALKKICWKIIPPYHSHQKGINFRSFIPASTLIILKKDNGCTKPASSKEPPSTWAAFTIGDLIRTNLPEKGTTTTIDNHTEKYIW